MKDEIQQERRESAEPIEIVARAAGRLFEHWGYRSVVGRIWAVCMLTSRPIDAATLQERLSISVGALNMGLRELVKLGFVYRETATAGRRFYYIAEKDLWVIARRVFRERERTKLEAVLGEIKRAEQMLLGAPLQDQQEVEAAHQLEQVRRLVGLGEFVLGLLDAAMERTRVELKAAQKWLSVSGKIGGEPLSRLRRAINANRLERKRRS